MERGHLWQSCFKLNLKMLELNGGGITDAMASRPPAESVSSAAWILGHVTHSRRALIERLGGSLPLEPVWAETYGRGGAGRASHLGFAALGEAFNGTSAPLKEAFRAVADWDAPTRNPFSGSDQALEQLVAFLYMHESYHLGQIGMLRKLYGLKGAV